MYVCVCVCTLQKREDFLLVHLKGKTEVFLSQYCIAYFGESPAHIELCRGTAFVGSWLEVLDTAGIVSERKKNIDLQRDMLMRVLGSMLPCTVRALLSRLD